MPGGTLSMSHKCNSYVPKDSVTIAQLLHLYDWKRRRVGAYALRAV